MTIKKNQESGAFEIYALIGNHLLTRTYYGYTRREAVAMFRAELKGAH